MPSKSGKQHRLMAAVANNPAFAKKVGISQSVGKEFMKADKRKGKKYALGGPTSYSGEDTDEGMKMSTRRMPSSEKKSGMSDEEKYGKVGAAIRRLDPEAFKNRTDRSAAGNLKLLKELQEKSKSPAAPKVEVENTETKIGMPASSGARGYRGSKPGSARVGSGRYDDPTSSYGERVTAPLRALGDIFGRRREEGVMRNMGVDRAEAARRLARLDEVRESEGMKRGGDVKKMRGGGMPDLTGDGKVTRADVLKGRGVFKHGGGIKKYANGGSVSSASKRADGIARKGKTKGRIC